MTARGTDRRLLSTGRWSIRAFASVTGWTTRAIDCPRADGIDPDSFTAELRWRKRLGQPDPLPISDAEYGLRPAMPRRPAAEDKLMMDPRVDWRSTGSKCLMQKNCPWTLISSRHQFGFKISIGPVDRLFSALLLRDSPVPPRLLDLMGNHVPDSSVRHVAHGGGETPCGGIALLQD